MITTSKRDSSSRRVWVIAAEPSSSLGLGGAEPAPIRAMSGGFVISTSTRAGITSADLVGVGRCRVSAHSVVVLPSRAVVAPNRLVRSVTVTGGAQDFALYDRCHVRMRRP